MPIHPIPCHPIALTTLRSWVSRAAIGRWLWSPAITAFTPPLGRGLYGLLLGVQLDLEAGLTEHFLAGGNLRGQVHAHADRHHAQIHDHLYGLHR
jgi:hypothetical protein